jgi:hypothetical protein
MEGKTMFICPDHGMSDGDSCKFCNYKISKRTTLRSLARMEGVVNYSNHCPTHGQTMFSVHTGKCLECFTTGGTARKPSVEAPRATARRAGDDKYIDQCETHGRAYFGVRYGKCLECFTTEGRKRAVRPSYVIGPE